MFRPEEKPEAGDFPASSVAEALPLVCNVPDEVLYRNIAATVARGHSLIQATTPHDGIALLIGGGPSLADDLEDIRKRWREGATIFALNGAALWLQDNHIAPDAVVILDARPHNVKFIRGVYPGATLYLASQCDPSIFEAGKRHTIVTWHPPMGGKSGVKEDRPTVLIGGSTTVGLRALRLVHVLGFREVHLFGYDSSYREGEAHAYEQAENASDMPRNCEVGGRNFVSTAWMIRQADDFRLISTSLMHEGMSIHVHGDGLLPTVARAMLVESPPPQLDKSAGFSVCYDLAALPVSFDAAVWLVIAEMDRRRQGVEGPLTVCFKPGEDGGFRKDYIPTSTEWRRGFLDNVMRPLVTLIGGREDDAAKDGRTYWYNPRDISAHYRDGEDVPRFGAKNDDLEIVESWLSERRLWRPIVITLREASHWPERNSNLDAWMRFAATCGEQVVFVRDTEKADRPLGQFVTCPQASRDLHFRMALYERALVNMDVCTGPSALLVYGTSPWMLFRPLVELDGWPCGTPQWWTDVMGVPPGTQFPWSDNSQRIIWAPDDFQTIDAAWRNFARLCLGPRR